MLGHPTAVLLAALLVAAPAARGETYKWVDERGVVNYSNSPPADARQAKGATKVDERLSTYAPDAATRALAARGPSYYEQQSEREWLQRQQIMAANAARPRPCAGAYSTDCYSEDPRFAGYATPYFGPVFVARTVRAFPRPHRPRASLVIR